jgi:hypothetical protein
MSPSGTSPLTCCDDVAAYDSVTNRVYFWDVRASCGSYSYSGLYAYSYANNAWTRINSDVLNNSSCGMAIDTKRRTLLIVGGGSVYAYNLDNLGAGSQTWTTTGGSSFVSQGAQGLEYDPVADRYVGWKGGAVYVLDPVTKAWTVNNPAGGPPSGVPGVRNGVYNRWQYVPSVNAFVTVVSVDGNVYFYKLTEGLGTGNQRGVQKRDIGITVRPNPFQDKVAVSVSGPDQDLQAAIYGIAGRKMFEGRGKGSLTCDASAFAPGIYLVKIRTDGRTATRRIVLSR